MGATFAAKINGEQVSWEAYNRTYQDLYRQAAEGTDEELSDERIQQIEQQAWQQILQDRLLMQQAKKYRLTVTEDEVYQYLRYNPPPYLQQMTQFQTEGKFDAQKYLQAMLDPQAAPFWASVEGLVRNDILKLKVQQYIAQTVQVTDDQVRQSFLNAAESLKVDLILIPPHLYANPPPTATDDELQAYYQENQGEFKVDERAVLKIASIQKVPSEADWERAYRRISIVYDSVMAGADFAEMAEMYSEDNSAKNGGDLGWFEKGRMVPAFDSLSFTMKAGDISQPFRTQFGWHIIKHFGYRTETKDVNGKKEKVQEAHVAHILIKTVPSTETMDSLFEVMNEFVASVPEKGFDSAAAEYGLKVDETPPFGKNQPIGMIGFNQKLNDFAFEQKPGALSDILGNSRQYFVAELEKHLPAGVAPFADVENRVKDIIVRNKMMAMARSAGQEMYDEIKNGKDMKTVAEEHGAQFMEPKPFNRNAYVQGGIGNSPAAIGAAFSLTEPGQLTEPVESQAGMVIFKLKERITPDLSTFTEKRDSVMQTLQFAEQQKVLNGWYQDLVEQSDIINNIASLNAQTDESMY
jgi:peptidyl-prolyl cis-trans isomerase D